MQPVAKVDICMPCRPEQWFCTGGLPHSSMACCVVWSVCLYLSNLQYNIISSEKLAQKHGCQFQRITFEETCFQPPVSMGVTARSRWISCILGSYGYIE
ncbi:hypothetical protein Mapa_011796 [Marchantia paleacea]|nr:hypothetical protein Mapa_011796 [Marchantia paleacea]